MQIPAAQPELELAEAAGHRVGPLVVGPQLGLRIQVAEHDHPARADHDGAAQQRRPGASLNPGRHRW
jgi:hypothetical protein